MKQLLLQLILSLHLFGNGDRAVALAIVAPTPEPPAIELVNKERAKEGLVLLTTSELLNASAKAKCDDMIAKDYWAHVAPDGSQPWYFIESAGYYYRYAGENLCRHDDNVGCMEGWMESPTHKENILRPEFKELGTAECGDIIVQHFGAAE